MDWPSRSIRSRLVWWRLTRKRQRARRYPAEHDRVAELASAIPAERRGTDGDLVGFSTTLHTIERTGGRAPLLVLTVIDSDGHLAEAVACDSEDYM